MTLILGDASSSLLSVDEQSTESESSESNAITPPLLALTGGGGSRDICVRESVTTETASGTHSPRRDASARAAQTR